jgi:integrase/recombinase XerD
MPHVVFANGVGRGLEPAAGTVELPPRAMRAIDATLGGRADGPLLVSNTGGRLDRHNAARIVTRLARRARLAKHITPHSLRHTMVTLALDAGVSLRDVQDAARHADPRTTRRYDRARHALDRHATYTLGAFLAGEVASPPRALTVALRLALARRR